MTRRIIVGGGIAGAALSRIFDDVGADYVCFEKSSKTACENKLCADGLTMSGAKILKRYGGDVEDFTEHEVYEVKINFFGREYSFKTKKPLVYIVDRGKLYDFIAPKNIEYNRRVTEISEKGDYVVLENGEKVEGLVYGADGATSKVRRTIYKDSPDYVICYLRDMDDYEGKWQDIIGANVGFHQPYGKNMTDIYAEYFFPSPKLAKVSHGVGFTIIRHTGFFEPEHAIAKNYVGDRFSDIEKLNEISPEAARQLNMQAYPIGFDFVKSSRLVGDAAGAAYLLTGEGIYPAMVTAIGALDSEDKDYLNFCKKKKDFDKIGREFWINHTINDKFRYRALLNTLQHLANPLYNLYIH